MRKRQLYKNKNEKRRGIYITITVGKSQRMPVERKHLLLCRYDWPFEGFTVGKSQCMSMGRSNLYLGRYEWAFGDVTVGKSQRVSMGRINLYLGR